MEYLGANGDIYSYNLYAYCSNNPVMYTDPSGEGIFTILVLLAVSTAVGGVWAGISSYNKGNRGVELAEDIFLGAAIGLAVGGAVFATSAVFVGARAVITTKAVLWVNATMFKVHVTQVFAIGGLAFDAVAFFVAPLYGVEMQGIEIDKPSSPLPGNPLPEAPHPAMKPRKF